MNSSLTILDGAMGTMLQERGLKPGERPEIWNIIHPEIIKDIHTRYLNAGSEVIYANTFCANSLKLNGTGFSVTELINAGIRNAKDAVSDYMKDGSGKSARVALDIGPTGELLEPYGDMEPEEAYEIFKEMVEAGTTAGADLIIFETMSDLEELKAGVNAAKENSDLPVWTTMTFDKNGRTFMGVSIEEFACAMNDLQVDALGFNCSAGPEDLIPLVIRLKQNTSLPIILKPNAGLPDSTTGKYNVDPDEFFNSMKKGIDAGASILGGCCGTDPEYIRKLSEL